MLVSLLFLSAAAAAPDWRVAVVSTDDKFGRSVAFVDASTLERTGDDIRMTMDLRVEHPLAQDVDGARIRMSIDCKGKTIEILGGDFFRGEVKRGENPPEATRPIHPGTNYDRLATNVCAGQYGSTGVDPVPYAREQFAQQAPEKK